MNYTFRYAGAALVLAIAVMSVSVAPDRASAQPMQSLAPLVKRASPAVVNIRVSQTVEAGSPYSDEMFRRFFGLPDVPGGSREVASAGSGVIVDAENGYILTNHHVVDGAEKIQISLYNDETLDAEIVGSDAATDIAVLKVESDDLIELPIGDSSAVAVGDFVIAIGNPFGLGHTVTSGIISALGRTGISRGAGTTVIEDFIQTDASINPGNSGGALVDMNGELVGINSAIISRTGGNIGIGFAVPSEIAQSIMHQIIDFGEVRRGLLGVTIQTIDKESAEVLGAEVTSGALITGIEPESAAEEAGLRVDDIIVQVNDKKIGSARELANAIGLKGSGEDVTVVYLRGGDQRSATATLGQATTRRSEGTDIHPGLEGAQFAAASNGVEVSTVEPGSPAAQRGLRPGDIVTAVNRQRVDTLEQLRGIAQNNRILFLLVQRDDRTLMLQIR